MGYVQGQWPDIRFKTSEGSFRVSELGVDNGVTLTGSGPFIDTDLDAQQTLVLMLRLAQAMGLSGTAMYTALQIEVARRITEMERRKRDQQEEELAMQAVMELAGRLSLKFFKTSWNKLTEGQKDMAIEFAKAQIKLEEKERSSSIW